MTSDIRETLQAYSLERYETEFADRHLLHGIVAKWAREAPERIALVDFDSGRKFTYRQLDDVTTALALKLLKSDIGLMTFWPRCCHCCPNIFSWNTHASK